MAVSEKIAVQDKIVRPPMAVAVVEVEVVISAVQEDPLN
jgi:hypothetical protein